MATYVQAPGSDTWHWCRNCSSYPSSPGHSETHPPGQLPSLGELCKECRDKEQAGRCQG
jgi:hypothetical protein